MTDIKNFFLRIWYNYRHWRYEQKCLKYFGAKPETIYLPAEDYDALVAKLKEKPDPKAIERFKQILEKVPPWEKEE
jgi:hypothetical protein